MPDATLKGRITPADEAQSSTKLIIITHPGAIGSETNTVARASFSNPFGWAP